MTGRQERGWEAFRSSTEVNGEPGRGDCSWAWVQEKLEDDDRWTGCNPGEYPLLSTRRRDWKIEWCILQAEKPVRERL